MLSTPKPPPTNRLPRPSAPQRPLGQQRDEQMTAAIHSGPNAIGRLIAGLIERYPNAITYASPQDWEVIKRAVMRRHGSTLHQIRLQRLQEGGAFTVEELQALLDKRHLTPGRLDRLVGQSYRTTKRWLSGITPTMTKPGARKVLFLIERDIRGVKHDF